MIQAFLSRFDDERIHAYIYSDETGQVRTSTLIHPARQDLSLASISHSGRRSSHSSQFLLHLLVLLGVHLQIGQDKHQKEREDNHDPIWCEDKGGDVKRRPLVIVRNLAERVQGERLLEAQRAVVGGDAEIGLQHAALLSNHHLNIRVQISQEMSRENVMADGKTTQPEESLLITYWMEVKELCQCVSICSFLTHNMSCASAHRP